MISQSLSSWKSLTIAEPGPRVEQDGVVTVRVVRLRTRNTHGEETGPREPIQDKPGDVEGWLPSVYPTEGHTPVAIASLRLRILSTSPGLPS